jgi:hypothetical protein
VENQKHCGGRDKKLVAQSTTRAPAIIPKKKRKHGDLVQSKMVNWVSFNYPLQADVLLSFLACRRAFNKWQLLGRAIGGKRRDQCATKADIHMDKVPHREMFVPSIPMADGTIYYPPIPGMSWRKANFEVTKNGRVTFPKWDVARNYTIIQFLLEKYHDGLDAYFSEILGQLEVEYMSQRTRAGSRLCDPIKMVVFFDNDHQSRIQPMAVLLLLRRKQGAFALVDDFGRVIQDTTYRFRVTSPVVRPIKY